LTGSQGGGTGLTASQTLTGLHGGGTGFTRSHTGTFLAGSHGGGTSWTGLHASNMPAFDTTFQPAIMMAMLNTNKLPLRHFIPFISTLLVKK
jgi:hypothetical protein